MGEREFLEGKAKVDRRFMWGERKPSLLVILIFER